MTLDFNEKFKKALHIMENTNQNLFITGRAGTGKSTLLNYFRTTTLKNIAVLAPTGVAAVNISGRTIHSFFKFKPRITLQTVRKMNGKVYKKLDAIIIDEISMARADLMDCVDKFLRINGKDPHKPFSGIQMIFCGDLHQLPPVVTERDEEIFRTHFTSPYFFGAKFFKNFDMEYIELDKMYRQKDEEFIQLLDRIRTDTIRSDDISKLNERHQPNFVPKDKDCYVYLTPKKAIAENVNQKRLKKLNSKLHVFDAEISKGMSRELFPAPEILEIKENSQIMMVNNDLKKRWINGTMGIVQKIEERHIVVALDNGKEVRVAPHFWDIFALHAKDEQLVARPMGSFKQYPMMLAWALTIHKSQGKTLSKVILDIHDGAFAPGQVYVALSRCQSFDGIVLKQKIDEEDIWVDDTVVEFLEKLKTQYME